MISGTSAATVHSRLARSNTVMVMDEDDEVVERDLAGQEAAKKEPSSSTKRVFDAARLSAILKAKAESREGYKQLCRFFIFLVVYTVFVFEYKQMAGDPGLLKMAYTTILDGDVDGCTSSSFYDVTTMYRLRGWLKCRVRHLYDTWHISYTYQNLTATNLIFPPVIKQKRTRMEACRMDDRVKWINDGRQHTLLSASQDLGVRALCRARPASAIREQFCFEFTVSESDELAEEMLGMVGPSGTLKTQRALHQTSSYIILGAATYLSLVISNQDASIAKRYFEANIDSPSTPIMQKSLYLYINSLLACNSSVIPGVPYVVRPLRLYGTGECPGSSSTRQRSAALLAQVVSALNSACTSCGCCGANFSAATPNTITATVVAVDSSVSRAVADIYATLSNRTVCSGPLYREGTDEDDHLFTVGDNFGRNVWPGVISSPRWLDVATTDVEVQAVLYNSDLERFAIVSAKFEIDSAGAVVPSVDLLASADVSSWWKPGWEFQAVVCLYISIFCVLTFVGELTEMWKEGVRSYFSEAWNMMDLIWCAAMLFAMALEAHKLSMERDFKLLDWGAFSRFFFQAAGGAAITCSEAEDPGKCYAAETLVGRSEWINGKFYMFENVAPLVYDDSVSGLSFFRYLQQHAQTSYVVRLLHALAITLSFIRCMKFFRYRGKLALLPKTLSGAASDLQHFMFTFALYLVGFVEAFASRFGSEFRKFDLIVVGMPVIYGVLIEATVPKMMWLRLCHRFDHESAWDSWQREETKELVKRAPVVISTSIYDVFYTHYYTCRLPVHIPSHFHATVVESWGTAPTQPAFVLWGGSFALPAYTSIHRLFHRIQQLVSPNEKGFHVVKKEQLMDKDGRFDHIAVFGNYIGIVLYPYSFSSAVFAELYATGIPLVVPSTKYLVSEFQSGGGIFHHSPNNLRCSEPSFDAVCTEQGFSVFDPNSCAKKALEEWVPRSQLGTFPSLLHFDSAEEAVDIMEGLHRRPALRRNVSGQMRQFSLELMRNSSRDIRSLIDSQQFRDGYNEL